MHVMWKTGCSLAYYYDISTYYQFIIYFQNPETASVMIPAYLICHTMTDRMASITLAAPAVNWHYW